MKIPAKSKIEKKEKIKAINDFFNKVATKRGYNNLIRIIDVRSRYILNYITLQII